MADTTHHALVASDLLRQCRAALAGMKGGLSSVMKACEQDFLKLGENLMALQSGCEGISASAGELVTKTSSGEMHTALDRLSGELTTLGASTSQDNSHQGVDDIENVAGIVDNLFVIVAAFSKIVKHLTMLGIATRIESARLGADGRGFSTLADDVEKLAHAIVDHCSGINTQVGTLRGHVASAKTRTLDIVQTQKHCFEILSRELAEHITGLSEMAERSADVSQQLTVTAGKIEADIGQAVRSLQSHDIVRQQIEHAEQAIAEVASVLDTELDKAGGDEDTLELLAFVADVSALQASQLESADTHFSEAATVLRDSLASLSAEIQGIGGTLAVVGGDEGSDSPLARVQTGIGTIKAELGNFAAQGEALGGIMDSVASTVTGMSGAIEAIEEVGAEIELIAINASIKAAHTGEAGAALGVLALAIQRLSVDARRQTDAVAKVLGDIAKASEILQKNASTYNDQSEAWRVVGELDAVLADVSETATQCRSLFASLRSSSTSLGARAAEVGAGIDFDKIIGDRLIPIRDALQTQVTTARQLVPEGGQGKSARLRELYDRYTMNAERAIHEAAFGLSSAPLASGDAVGTQEEESGEFGDNVELF